MIVGTPRRKKSLSGSYIGILTQEIEHLFVQDLIFQTAALLGMLEKCPHFLGLIPATFNNLVDSFLQLFFIEDENQVSILKGFCYDFLLDMIDIMKTDIMTRATPKPGMSPLVSSFFLVTVMDTVATLLSAEPSFTKNLKLSEPA